MQRCFHTQSSKTAETTIPTVVVNNRNNKCISRLARRKSHHTALSNAATTNSDCLTEPWYPIPNPHRASLGAVACIQLGAVYIPEVLPPP